MRYLSSVPEKQSVAVFVQPKSKNKSRKVGILYIRSFLIIHEPNKKENVFKIIYLEGLDVTKIYDEAHGSGVAITHRNGIYPEKKLFFVND